MLEERVDATILSKIARTSLVWSARDIVFASTRSLIEMSLSTNACNVTFWSLICSIDTELLLSNMLCCMSTTL